MRTANPILDEKGQAGRCRRSPKSTAICGTISSRNKSRLARRGLWKVVNEGAAPAARRGCPACRWRAKTGTAQAMTDGKKDTIAWFACFAPYDKPSTPSRSWCRAVSMAVPWPRRSRREFSNAPSHGGGDVRAASWPGSRRRTRRTLSDDRGGRFQGFRSAIALRDDEENLRRESTPMSRYGGGRGRSGCRAGSRRAMAKLPRAQTRRGPRPAPTAAAEKPNFFERLFGAAPASAAAHTTARAPSPAPQINLLIIPA